MSDAVAGKRNLRNVPIKSNTQIAMIFNVQREWFATIQLHVRILFKDNKFFSAVHEKIRAGHYHKKE